MEGIGAAQVFGLVERADLAGDVPFEHSAAEDQAKECKEKCGLKSHQEMTRCHGERAEENGAAPAEHTIGEEAAEDWSEINAGGVGAEDRRGERLAVETALKLAKAIERRNVFNAPRQQEILDQVKDEQRLHAIIGEAFPRLREREVPESAWVAEEIRGIVFAGKRSGVIGLGGGCHVGEANEELAE